MQSLMQEMTIEDAVEKVKDLMGENRELREILHQNNDVLRNQHQLLVNMKSRQEDEKKLVEQKFNEAKDVVMALREEVQTKSRLLDELQRNLKDQFEIISKRDVLAMTGSDEKKEEQEKDSEELLWLSQYDQLKSTDYKNLPEKETSAEAVVKKLQEDLDLATELIESQRKVKERLEMEKRELIAMNNALNSHMALWMSSAASSPEDTLKSEVIFDREKELARLRAGKDADDMESVSLTSQPLDKKAIFQQKEQQMVQQLLLQLQEERDTTSQLHTQLSDSKAQIEKLEQELETMRQNLSDKDNEMAAKLQEMTRKHKEEMEEMFQSKANDKETGSIVEMQSLQQQVVSMASEMQQAYKQVEDCKNTIQQYKDRIKELQEKRDEEQLSFNQNRVKMEEQMKTLNMANLTLQATRKKLQDDLAETQRNFEELLNDFHLLGKQNEELKRAAGESRSIQDKFHTASVRLAAAQEALEARSEEISLVSHRLSAKENEICSLRSRLIALESEIDTIPVLKNQVEIYRCDFEAERHARERQHEEKERLKEELLELHRRNAQLLDEMQSYASNQFAAMRNEHGYMSYSMLSGYEQPQASQNAQQMATYHPGATTPPGGARENPRSERMRSQQTFSAMETMDNAEYHCPKCRRKCPDFDTLNIHVNECLDEDDS